MPRMKRGKKIEVEPVARIAPAQSGTCFPLGGRVWRRKKIPAGEAAFNPTGKN
jgi:hypothetical protein